jgi:hypothetical protein
MKKRARKAKEARLVWEKEKFEQVKSHALALAVVSSNKTVAEIKKS